MTFLKIALFAATLAVANLSYAADGSERSISHNQDFRDSQAALQQHREMHETLAQEGRQPDKASNVKATN
ncbi:MULTISPECIES: hypothetical protein [Pseudomonas]|jgi:hypothetical protein|uniref:Secreted protein n=5 Tax=Pseudomonas TaxID=286 RepID=A0ABX3ITN7_9PSED|nr:MULTISPECIES: hypothetical protein [Pseudomonas]EHK69147.1 hypothetical protein PPL19_20881 [Pseudomonas psychrotolerans L19]KIZ52764.1 hypothetical protein UM91_01195 [Pseudomonas oryzihabitans]KXJ33211.1 hypothetical protein AX284_08470 [Pseudomonas sp. HUK17]MBA1183227.1 hypothetical protein [Pseudomonas psychrotolerans]MBA1256896.1 hypothetical protein [Pseudomonas psychrotolerans]